MGGGREDNILVVFMFLYAWIFAIKNFSLQTPNFVIILIIELVYNEEVDLKMALLPSSGCGNKMRLSRREELNPGTSLILYS